MYDTIILDFVGVIADIDFIKLVKDLPLKQKFSSLRVFLTIKKNPIAKGAFKDYQKGIINLEEFQDVISEICPKSAYVLPVVLGNIRRYATVNEEVLGMAEVLRNKGIKIIVISNTIPETEKIINDNYVADSVDGIVCSTHVKLRKPSPDIFKYAIETYNIDPTKTVMIDDSEKNLVAARKFGIQTEKCKNSKETYEFLTEVLETIDINERKLRYNKS